MAFPKVLSDVIGFVSGAVTRIFGLNDDHYPDTGVQPFEGEPFDKKTQAKDQ